MSLSTAQESGSRSAQDGVEVIPADSLDELIPDPNFSAVLNSDMEVQVGSQIYKITPYGTFFFDEDKLGIVNDLVKDQYVPNGEVKKADYLYQVQDGIFRYDTYGEVKDNTVTLEAEGSNAGGRKDALARTASSCSFTQPLTPNGSFLNETEYCSFSTFSFGAQTVVGKWIENIFGSNSDRTENFDSKNRVKVKLYNFNYFVYSSIGLKVKYQKKGWTGIWDKKDTEKLVIGWDAILFETPMPYSQPLNWPSFPSTQLSKEVFKFINFEIPANTYTRIDDRLFGRSLYDQDDISKILNSVVDKQLANITKQVWEYTEKNLTPDYRAYREERTKAFRQIYPDKFVTLLSRWEQSKTNDGEIDCQFDWNTCQISFKGTIGGSFDAMKNVVEPTINKQAKSYTIKKASIYGAAKYGGQWKGLRIIQD